MLKNTAAAEGFVGFVLNTPGHWTAVRPGECGGKQQFMYIDSQLNVRCGGKQGQKYCCNTLEHIAEKNLRGRVASIIVVHNLKKHEEEKEGKVI